MLQSVQKYNALNGVVSRLQIQELKLALDKDEQTFASKKLETLLNRNPEVENFEIEIVNPIREASKGLNGGKSSKKRPSKRMLPKRKAKHKKAVTKEKARSTPKVKAKGKKPMKAKPKTKPVKPVKRKKHSVPKPIIKHNEKTRNIKADANGVERLFAVLDGTRTKPVKRTPPKKNVGLKGVENSLLQRKQQQDQQRQFFELLPKHKDLETLLGKVEIQKKESAVMTLSAPQGSGKTTAVFQMMNAFAESGYNTLFASLEEHPDSYLFEKKADQYLTEEAQSRISAPHYSSNNVKTLLKDIENADVIFIDSMKKLWQYIKGFDLDNDLRKAYNGKLFVIIFQLTSTGKMRGGSDAQFDGDIISFIEKHDDFSENYIYHDKNRYAIVPIHETKFNIVSQSLVGNEVAEPTGLKFNVV